MSISRYGFELSATFPELALVPDPLDVAVGRISSVEVGEPGLWTACRTLLDFTRSKPEGSREAIGAVVAALENVVAWDEWAEAALEAVERTREPRLLELVAARAASLVKSPRIVALLRKANEVGTSERLVTESVNVLEMCECDLDAAHLAGLLARRAPNNPILNRWIRVNRKERYACFALRELVLVEQPEALVWAREWIDDLAGPAEVLTRVVLLAFSSRPHGAPIT